MFQCHVREVDNLPDSFAMAVRDETFIVVVRRGLLAREDIQLLDRLLKRGLAELIATTDLALTS